MLGSPVSQNTGLSVLQALSRPPQFHDLTCQEIPCAVSILCSPADILLTMSNQGRSSAPGWVGNDSGDLRDRSDNGAAGTLAKETTRVLRDSALDLLLESDPTCPTVKTNKTSPSDYLRSPELKNSNSKDEKLLIDNVFDAFKDAASRLVKQMEPAPSVETCGRIDKPALAVQTSSRKSNFQKIASSVVLS